MQHNRGSELKGRGFGPYVVTTVSHFTIRLADGTDIALRLWMPLKADKVARAFVHAKGVKAYCDEDTSERSREVGDTTCVT